MPISRPPIKQEENMHPKMQSKLIIEDLFFYSLFFLHGFVYLSTSLVGLDVGFVVSSSLLLVACVDA